MPAWVIQIIIALVMMVIGYIIAPKAKRSKPESTSEEMDDPTCESGKPIPLVFGTVTIKSPNILWHGDKRMEETNA